MEFRRVLFRSGMAAAGATGVFGYAAFFLMGLQHVPAGKAALVITLNPVLTLALAVWLFGERLNRTIALGMALAACGAVVVISQDRKSTRLNSSHLVISYAVFCLKTKIPIRM